MNRRTRISIAAATAVAAAGTAGALLIPAASASGTAHHPPTHTLTFTSVQQAVAEFSTTGAQVDKEVDKKGKVIGFDVTHITANPKTGAVTMDVAASFAGGILYGKLSLGNGPVSRGIVTGGTGSFKGARGTIVAKAIDPNGAKTAVTVTYHT